jgi:hypothetical protein
LGEIATIFKRTASALKEIYDLPRMKVVEPTAALLDIDPGEDLVDQDKAGILIVQGCNQPREEATGSAPIPGRLRRGATPKYKKNSLVNICLLD